MDIIQAIILGLIQGLTEFIPVSSSGHLTIAGQIMQIPALNFHFFLEFINLGTLLALLIYFRAKIKQILVDILQNHNYQLATNILITSIPAGLIGLIFAKVIESNNFFSSIFTVCGAMAIVGLLMIIINFIPHFKPLKSEQELTAPRALAIGLSQIFALVPGVSRSGSTIITGRIVGLDSKAAAEYSFLASIPIMLGVCLKMFISPDSLMYFGQNVGLLLIGNLVAFISGLIALKFLLKYLKRPSSLQSFGKYRLVAASIVLGIALIFS